MITIAAVTVTDVQIEMRLHNKYTMVVITAITLQMFNEMKQFEPIVL